MSQPWRPSRGSSNSRWRTWSSSTNGSTSSGGRAGSSRDNVAGRQANLQNARTDDGGISSHGLRNANLRPVRSNAFDLSSPSRGETAPGRSLTDIAVQDDFRRHLEEKVKRYQTQFPNELAIVLSSPGHEAQRDQLDLILLDFRKLREGIIASGRKDAFAIEVYETSAKLALLGRNAPQIATILPHLVRVLHWPSQLSKAAASSDLEGQMATLRLKGDSSHLPVTPLDTRARFAAYYLLYRLLASRDRAAFSRLLGDLVDFGASSENARIPYTNVQIQLVLRLFRLDMTGNYAGISKILSEPRKYDKFAWIIVRSSVAGFREHAWAVLRASYMATNDKKWLARSLCLEQSDDGGLQTFLEGKAWKDNVEADGTVLLKRGKTGG